MHAANSKLPCPLLSFLTSFVPPLPPVTISLLSTHLLSLSFHTLNPRTSWTSNSHPVKHSTQLSESGNHSYCVIHINTTQPTTTTTSVMSRIAAPVTKLTRSLSTSPAVAKPSFILNATSNVSRTESLDVSSLPLCFSPHCSFSTSAPPST
ncbi:uncharacterized protein B0T23DRAFT_37658 [Neurospora hispaniola]|uniref:Uncharacterized protein n=1 Tax=Neurospora hispaniola TaxID=588809 RepID=A0AAJ0MVX6_9PEZI|nr:hypothetical protein B0T23DRAFT_37658 [Neurospora hispaniola]